RGMSSWLLVAGASLQGGATDTHVQPGVVLSGLLRDRGLEPGYESRGCRTAEARKEHRELVAAQPGNEVVWPDLGFDAVRYCPQRQVTCLVAPGVVDGLEIVGVYHQQADRQAVARGALQLLRGALLEPAPIKQLRERIS